MSASKFIAIFASACFFVTGCSTNSLYLASYSRAAIDASSDGAGIGVKSGYIHVTPTSEDGIPYTVIGESDIDLSALEAVISETLATGLAAICASLPTRDSLSADQKNLARIGPSGEPDERAYLYPKGRNQTSGRERPTLIFGSYTSYSLVDLSWADATSQGITFGYKRSSGMKIPIQDGAKDVGSAYAHVTVNTTTDMDQNPTRTYVDGIRTTHTFATGKAAIIKASANALPLNGMSVDNSNKLGCLD